ncbi:hypothetical protein HYC85_023066 [Camellia sinensis]|uniref:Uncharacterized protein n=1 Tax=Camellia sinensis TaxID=4442 RepID=A0A7J7GE42_CAMSI|nr:hypothetical protein HYC85_023066 [Camellia sinensis]
MFDISVSEKPLEQRPPSDFSASFRNHQHPLLSTLQSQNRGLRLKLLESEHRLSQVHSRRREDSKANARVVEIFASHRHCWQEEEKCLLRQIDSGEEEITRLCATVEELEKSEAEMRQNVEELRRVNEGRNHEMLNFMAARSEFEEFSDCGGGGECCSESARFGEVGDVQYESVESLCHLKHFVSSNKCLLFQKGVPWKVDGESTGVSSKLELLEHELMKLERIGKGDQSKVRKKAKRYQALSRKIDDLCKRVDSCNQVTNLRKKRDSAFLRKKRVRIAFLQREKRDPV